MIYQGRDPRAFMVKYVREAYIDAQNKRFMTKNTSQGEKWAALNPIYAEYKLKKFKDFPGGGRKINVATGRLFNALILEGKGDYSEMVFAESYVIAFKPEYAKYVDEVRPIVQFRKEFYADLRKKAIKWMSGEKV